jgi:hypothetical protein
MAFYWNKNSIPALKGRTVQERMALIQPVMGAVWRRWQVWLPILSQVVIAFTLMLTVPPFPYRMAVVLGFIYVTVKLSFLPYNHYLAQEIEKSEAERKGVQD